MNIFYGVIGEGLGHAIRATCVIENIPNVNFHIFTYGRALEYFQQIKHPFLHSIYGPKFVYRKGKVDRCRSALGMAKYVYKEMPANVIFTQSLAKKLSPTLCISDFEPSIPRLAKQIKSPLLSVDNQHRFCDCKMTDLPLMLKMYAKMMGCYARWAVPNPNGTAICTFHYDAIEHHNGILLTNGLLRKEINQPTNENFVLVYLRDSISDKVLKHLCRFKNTQFKIYGASDTNLKKQAQQKIHSNIKFFPISNQFVCDLKKCKGVISTAGNQLVSETRYLGKPILAIPEPGQFEQRINARYIEKLGLGTICSIDNLSVKSIRQFLKTKFDIKPSVNGTKEVTDFIQEFLNRE